MRTKKRLDGAAFGALFLLAAFVFIAADDALAQGMGAYGGVGFSRSGTASSGSFAQVQKQQARQFQQNMKQEKLQIDQQNRQSQQNIEQEKSQTEQQNLQPQQNIKLEEWQKQQQARPEYVSDYDDYQK
jgi:hypothetical protein